jgi:hypothetical protein
MTGTAGKRRGLRLHVLPGQNSDPSTAASYSSFSFFVPFFSFFGGFYAFSAFPGPLPDIFEEYHKPHNKPQWPMESPRRFRQ